MSSSNRESTDLAEDGAEGGALRKRERGTEMGWGGAVGMRRGGREPSCPKSCRQPASKGPTPAHWPRRQFAPGGCSGG